MAILESQRRVLFRAVVILIAINVWGALWSLTLGPYCTVGPEIVNVYDNQDLAPLVPVMHIIAPRPVDTGQKVSVAIGSNYRLWKAQIVSILNLTVILIGFLFYRKIGINERIKEA
jgi:hypothetical protein